ncbi:DNA-binding transcriptional regulator, Lrp family [Halogranum gelatinilyticum]|uniref:DNA-binding transcriptional regulator, Lrp family n=1 Tax=Halogranum gelatinilyticum TaxID=660521 RepID=A0A1G9RGZ7_9EURY|nr:AsnC family transcriptional regulator [Halogranum gelatinilyticum]SDM22518.1 DNA-binding transcriptional regulator, Lrp family [Halogranum gelatinilyticum]
MRDLDDTDRHILRLLVENARRPYSDLADHVGLSAPAVSDRIDRLQELGVIRGFTVDVDRSLLRSGVLVLVELDVPVDRAGDVADALAALDAVEHTFETADGTVLVQATVRDGDVTGLLAKAVDLDTVRDVDVRLLRDAEWTPSVGEATLALTCAECGNSVTSEGESARLGGDLYHFCCGTCLANFEERFERLESGA